MENRFSSVKGGWRRYWRRRSYRRLDGGSRKNLSVVRFGGEANGKKPARRIRGGRKLRWRAVSPLRLWAKFKNAYINTMLRLAGNVGHLNGGNLMGGKRIPKARQVNTSYSNAEFENRLIYEIYKSIAASRELYGN